MSGSTSFSVTSPPTTVVDGQTFIFNGLAGSTWVNVACFDVNWNKISGDDTPNTSTGAWTLTCSTSTLTVGSNTLNLAAFSVAAGMSGGTDSVLNPSITVTAATGGGTGGYANGGLDLSASPYNLTLPTTDFFGNPIPNANGKYNRGADGNTI